MKVVLCEDGKMFKWKYSDRGLDEENQLHISDEINAELVRGLAPLEDNESAKRR